ncbi:hypothetical protein [Cellulomonas hominis]
MSPIISSTAIRSVVTLAVAGLLAVAGAGAATTEEVPPDTLTWSLVPADPTGAPDGRQSFRSELDAGQTATENAVLTNYSDSAVTFELTASDGLISEDGSFDILQNGEEPQDGGAWITVQDEVEVGPESSVVVPFRITVPADAVPGDHPAGLTAGISSDSVSAAGTGVGLQARVGLRIHLRVAGEITAALEVPSMSVRYEYSWNPFAPGRAVVTYDVENAGNVRVRSAETVQIAGPFAIGPRDAAVARPQEMLPSTSRSVTRVIDGLWPLARLGTTLVATPSSIGEDDLGPTAPAVVTVTRTSWVVPWPQLVLLVLLVGAVVLVRRARSRRRADFADALRRAREEGARVGAASQSPGQTP